MAINIWQLGGQPTSFNPLPASASIIGLPIGDYEISFRAKSDGNSVFRVTDNGNISYVHNITLTPVMTEYKISLNQKKENRFYLFDLNNKGDIIIENINLVEKPMGKATINGLEGFGRVKEGFTGKLSAITDFTGKISGSMVENPNRASHSTVETTLKSPSFFTFEPPQSNYDSVKSLDDNKYNASRSQSGAIAQQLFSFDVIDAVEKQIGAIPASDKSGKIAWLTNNVSRLSANWQGYGSSPTGYKATFRLWFYGANAWGVTTASHTGNAVATLNRSISTDIGNTIGSDGIVHAIAYAEASDGTTSSSISTDYISLTIEMKQETIVDSKWTFHPNVTLVDNESFKLEANNSFQNSTLWVDVLPNTTYTFSMNQALTQYAYSHEFDANGNRVKDVIFTTMNGVSGMASKTFTTSSSTRKLSLQLLNSTVAGGTFIFDRPMFNMGNLLPYEPKRGERMVMPTPTKNVFDYTLLTDTSAVAKIPNGYRATSYANLVTHPFKLKPNTTYTFSANVDVKVGTGTGLFGRVTIADGAGNWCHMNTGGVKGSVVQTFTTPIDVHRYTMFYVYGSSTTNEVVEITNIQIEEGSASSSYEPYKVQINAKPSKNLKSIYKPIDYGFNYNFTSLGDYSFNTSSNSAFYYVEGKKIPVLPNTEYTYSFRQEVVSGGACFTNVLFYPDNSSGVTGLIGEGGYTPTITSGYIEKTFTTPPNCNYIAVRVARSNTSRIFNINYYDFRLGLKGEMENKIAFGKSKNLVQKSDFMEDVSGLARPLMAYGAGGYSISDEVYIPNTRSQRAVWTSPLNDGVKQLNRGFRLNLNELELSNLEMGGLYLLSFYGKGWEDKGSISFYAVNTSDNRTPARESLGNGWYRYTYQFRYISKEGIVYVRPHNNADYSYDVIMNGLQIEPYGTDKPSPYKPFKLEGKRSYKGLMLDGKDDYLRYTGFDAFANKNFTIESSFTFEGDNAVNSAQQTIFSCGDIRFGINNVTTGWIGVYTPASNWSTTQVDLRKGITHKMKAVYTPTSFSIYVNDVLIETKAYTGDIKPYSSAYIGNLGGGSYYFNGKIHTMKVTIDNITVIDLDFNTPAKVVGNTIVDRNGGTATIVGSPTQLNKLARR